MEFSIKSDSEFNDQAIQTFRYQSVNCQPYSEYIKLLGISPDSITNVEDIPFLPISLFRTHRITTHPESEPQVVFSSSGTTGSQTSQHMVHSLDVYERAFIHNFQTFYGDVSEWAIFALLPNYLERSGSSLIYMVEKLVSMNSSGYGGFYLYNHLELINDIEKAARNGQRIMLLGVTFALLDFAEQHSIDLPPGSVVMETGGMKGRRAEISRDELHTTLCGAFGVDSIHSEYGMTELLSQAYSLGSGVFRTPSLMRVVPRDLSNPLLVGKIGKISGLNIIDLSNLYSCSFIATGDQGIVHEDGSFEVLGRITGEILRGCNMLTE